MIQAGVEVAPAGPMPAGAPGADSFQQAKLIQSALRKNRRN